MNKTELTKKIKEKALELGFLSCGIAKSEFLASEAGRLEDWLKRGYNGSMTYMENHFDKRLNPGLLVDDAKSVISVLLNYFPAQSLFSENELRISKYAYGQDYHLVVKEKLTKLSEYIISLAGERSIRGFTDSAPVLEKAWAERAGLGWIGKNGNLLTQQVGSFYFLGELIVDLDLDYDHPVSDHCGSCTKCIDACPTQAIIKPYVVDGSRCISYLTIELKDEFIPSGYANQMDNWIFGCDVCQDVCPWNRFAKPTNEPAFEPLPVIKQKEFLDISEEVFQRVFKFSAIKRTKLKGFRRNILFVNGEKK